MTVLQWLQEALMDFRAYAILVLIVMDVLLAIGVAIKAGNFDPKKLAIFYKTNVLPYFLGYVAFYVGIKAFDAGLVEIEWYDKFNWLLDPGALWAAWVALVGTIGTSIAESVLGLYGGNLIDRVRAKMGR